jgi:hypothetical protein
VVVVVMVVVVMVVVVMIVVAFTQDHSAHLAAPLAERVRANGAPRKRGG